MRIQRSVRVLQAPGLNALIAQRITVRDDTSSALVAIVHGAFPRALLWPCHRSLVRCERVALEHDLSRASFGTNVAEAAPPRIDCSRLVPTSVPSVDI